MFLDPVARMMFRQRLHSFSFHRHSIPKFWKHYATPFPQAQQEICSFYSLKADQLSRRDDCVKIASPGDRRRKLSVIDEHRTRTHGYASALRRANSRNNVDLPIRRLPLQATNDDVRFLQSASRSSRMSLRPINMAVVRFYFSIFTTVRSRASPAPRAWRKAARL